MVSREYIEKLMSVDYLGAVLMVFSTDTKFTNFSGTMSTSRTALLGALKPLGAHRSRKAEWKACVLRGCICSSRSRLLPHER